MSAWYILKFQVVDLQNEGTVTGDFILNSGIHSLYPQQSGYSVRTNVTGTAVKGWLHPKVKQPVSETCVPA